MYEKRMATDEKFCTAVLCEIVDFYMRDNLFDEEFCSYIKDWYEGDVSRILEDFPSFETRIKEL